MSFEELGGAENENKREKDRIGDEGTTRTLRRNDTI